MASCTVATPYSASLPTSARSARGGSVTTTLSIAPGLSRVGGPQRVDDTAQVPPDGAVGRFGLPVGDRVDDGQVLGQRLLGPARAERELELVPDDLRVQPLEQAHRDGLAGDDADPAVQFPVQLRVLQ